MQHSLTYRRYSRNVNCRHILRYNATHKPSGPAPTPGPRKNSLTRAATSIRRPGSDGWPYLSTCKGRRGLAFATPCFSLHSLPSCCAGSTLQHWPDVWIPRRALSVCLTSQQKAPHKELSPKPRIASNCRDLRPAEKNINNMDSATGPSLQDLNLACNDHHMYCKELLSPKPLRISQALSHPCQNPPTKSAS